MRLRATTASDGAMSLLATSVCGEALSAPATIVDQWNGWAVWVCAGNDPLCSSVHRRNAGGTKKGRRVGRARDQQYLPSRTNAATRRATTRKRWLRGCGRAVEPAPG